MMKFIFWSFLFAALPIWALGQSNTSLQKVTWTSVALKMDSVDTVDEIALVRQAVTAHKEVADFDAKFGKCNFTMTGTTDVLDLIVKELTTSYRQPVLIVAVRTNESFTRVPEESCDASRGKYNNMSEEEVKRQGISRKGGQ